MVIIIIKECENQKTEPLYQQPEQPLHEILHHLGHIPFSIKNLLSGVKLF